MKRVLFVLTLLCLVATMPNSPPDEDDPKVFLPLIQFTPTPLNPPRPKPHTTLSYYIRYPDELYDLGCEAAMGALGVPSNHVTVILHFGIASYKEGEHGVKTYDGERTFRTLNTVRVATIAFTQGYYQCSYNPPFPSQEHAPALYLAVGLHNQEDMLSPATDFGFEHGRAWGLLVDEINNNLLEINDVFVLGAIDLEPEFNTPEASKAWVDGFFDPPTYPDTPQRYLYNFGTAGGCAVVEDIPVGYPSELVNCSAGNFTWTLTDLWAVTTSYNNLRVFPQIYRDDGLNALQWHRLTRQALREGEEVPLIRGVLTTHAACEQLYRPELGIYEDKDCGAPDTVVTINNTPEQGWAFLLEQFYQTNETVWVVHRYRLRYSSDMIAQE